MTSLFKNLIFCVLIMFSSFAYAADYFISYSTGNDVTGDGSQSNPWKTSMNVSGEDFLQPGDSVNYMEGDTWPYPDAWIYSTSGGTADSGILWATYGASSDPIFDNSIDQSDISGWTGWTSVDGAVYESNVTIGFGAINVIVDDAATGFKSLGREQSSYSSTANYEKGRFSQDGSNIMRVRLWDDSDPNNSNMRFVREGYGGQYRGAIRTGGSNGSTAKGAYNTFRDLHVKGGGMCFSSSAQHVTFQDTTAEYCGREAYYFIAQDVTAPGADYNTCLRCEGYYSNARLSNGTGQQFTVESSYVDLINITSKYGWMAGVDFLNYSANTRASYIRLINSTISRNSLRSLQSADNGGFDPQVYNDGGNNLQIIGNVIQGNNPTTGFTSQNAIGVVVIGTEDDTKPAHDVLVMDNLIYGGTWTSLNSSTLSGNDLNYNIWFIGNTVSGAVGTWIVRMADLRPDSGIVGHIYNNIINNGNSAPALLMSTGVVASDYNLLNNNDSSGLIYSNGAERTLASHIAVTGNDKHSIEENISFTGDYYIDGTGAVDAGLMVWDKIIEQSDLGSALSSGVTDDINAWDIGFHHNSTFDCSYNWWDSDGTNCTGGDSILGAVLNGFNG